MSDNIYAHTAPGATYPEYISVNIVGSSALFSITVRSPPTTRDGAYVCGYARDKGRPGRCTPGDDHCNNYCNMAPEKGEMQDHPKACQQVTEGATAQITLTKPQIDALAGAILSATEEGAV